MQSVNLICEFILLNVYPFLNLCDCIKGLSDSLLSKVTTCVFVGHFLNQYVL